MELCMARAMGLSSRGKRNVSPRRPRSCGKAGFGRRLATYQVGEKAMFSHVMVGTDDIAASKKFYDAVLGAIGIPSGIEDPPGWREGTFGKLYLAYLRDPYGNKICALHRG